MGILPSVIFKSAGLVMLAGVLGLSYFGLCCISFLVSNLHKGKVEKFLNQNPVISDGKVLDEFKVIAREGMYISILQLSIFGISLVIAALLLWLKGVRTGISFGLLGLAFGLLLQRGNCRSA
jgi:hypothetical protein